MSELHELLGRVAFPETPEDRDDAENAVSTLLAAAWDSGYRASNWEWEQTADIVTPDEDRFIAKNPYAI